MSRNTIRNDQNNLAKWVFGVAGIFGYWPFTCNVSSINQFKRLRMTSIDWIRLVGIFGIQSICLWYHLSTVSFYSTKGSGASVNILIFAICVQFSLFIIPFNICKRQSLLKIICLNQEFDRKVSGMYSDKCVIMPSITSSPIILFR